MILRRKNIKMTPSLKALFTFIAMGLFAIGAFADGNLTSSVKVVRDKQIQVPFPPEFSVPPVVEYMQFQYLDWSATTGEIAASAIQGPYVYLVNPATGATRTIRTAARGAGRALTWLPNTTLLIADGAKLDPYGNAQVYDTAGDVTQPALSSFMNIRIEVKGITMDDGRPGFVVIGDPKLTNVDNGVKYYAYIHAGPDWKPVRKVQVFPSDGTVYHVESAAVTQTPIGVYTVLQAHQVIRPGGARLPDGHWQTPITKDVAFIVNLSTDKTLCQIDIFGADPTIDRTYVSLPRGIGISKNGRWMAISTQQMFDLYDVKTCKRLHRLSDRNDFYPRGAGFVAPVFTSDEKYLILAGNTVRTSQGGYLNIWRVVDGKLIYHAEVLRPQALTVDPNSKRFVVGHAQGQLTFFHIED